jgi:phospholipid/cholesterol/gamma-HCH transport system substrate-binding protein
MILTFDTKEKIVGTFVASLFILLLCMVVVIGRGKNWFRSTVMYYTNFNESYGLEKNASIKLFNAEIGKIKKIELAGNRVRIDLAIFEEFSHRIKADSIASVEGVSYIGSKYISIKPGTEDSPMLYEDDEIKSIENKSITDILSEFEVEKTAKMLIKAIQELSELAQILKDPTGPLFTAINSLNNSLKEVEKRIGVILGNVETATGRVPGTVDLVDTDLLEAKKMILELQKGVDLLNKTLANVEQGSRDVPPLILSTEKGVREIRDGVEEIDDVVQSVKRNPFIRSNLPPEPESETGDAGLR